MKYSEKIVAITGAAVGIGRATAEAFVNDGARLQLLTGMLMQVLPL